jgi:hypothetical protein
MGKTPDALAGPPDWAREPLQRFANIDETTDGFTELRVHGVSGPPPDRVLDYPAAVVTLVQGTPRRDSGDGGASAGNWKTFRTRTGSRHSAGAA